MMIRGTVDTLLRRQASWISDSGPGDDIAISSRIRLARNFADTPFPISASDESLCRLRDRVLDAFEEIAASGKILWEEYPMDDMDELDRQFLLERRLISREFMQARHCASLVVRQDESLGVMINEEDHLRMQSIGAGFQLGALWELISGFDDTLSAKMEFAFDSRLGYLTSCPTNIGTGMRASVMLHLPGLFLTGQMKAVTQGVAKLGLAVRGFYGEGSDTLGNLFQISNQSTLGESEEQIIDRLSTVITQIIDHEKKARGILLSRRQNFLMNHVGRAYGLLRHSYVISSEEALNSLSALRLGVDMGMFESVDIHTVNELFLLVQAAHLQKHEDRRLDTEDRDAARAALIRSHLN